MLASLRSLDRPCVDGRLCGFYMDRWVNRLYRAGRGPGVVLARRPGLPPIAVGKRGLVLGT